MKTNQLHTVNRWNMPALIGKKNVFLSGGQAQGIKPSSYTGLSQPAQNFLNNPSSLNIKPRQVQTAAPKQTVAWEPTTMQAIGAGASAVGSVATGDRHGAFDTLDPVHQLAGGKESGVGNAVEDAGVGLFQTGASTGNPWLMLAGAGAKITGGLTNAAFGMKTDKERLNNINSEINVLQNMGSVSSFDKLGPLASRTNTNGVYEGGWFTKGKARRKNRELAERQANAIDYAERNMDNNILNLTQDNINSQLANYSAFGGPIDTGSGAIDYGFMSDYLTMRNRQTAAKDRMPGMTGMPAFMNSFAIGGDLQTHGSDFSTGLTTIGAGGSHEENKYDGVQVGIDGEGTPNLVEEGETIYNDYVYSTRIKADAETKQHFHLPKKADISFADISKKLEKEAAERPNDAISQNALRKQMEELAEHQERQKQQMEAERAKEAFEALSPEEQTAIMQQRAIQEQQAQEAMMQQQAAEMTSQPTEEELAVAQQQSMMADGSAANLGGEPQDTVQMNCMGGKINKFEGGGPKNAGTRKQGAVAGDDRKIVPVLRNEGLRYAGLFGPAVGLGLMAAGVGRPDTSQLDAAISGAGAVSQAKYQPLGNYLRYRPLDIWYEQNRLNANARATDRSILNSGANQGSKMAGLLASGYNDQIASGNLFRQAQEYNDALRERVASFNRGTDQYNSQQYGETSRFNASARNQARQQNASLRLQAAAQKMAADAGWYNSLYGNISGLFKGLSDLGTENYRMNRISEMGADGLFGNLGQSYTGRRAVTTKKKARGGKIGVFDLSL